MNRSQRLLLAQNDTLFAGALFNLLLALWSAVQGTRWVLMALTAVNRRAETAQNARPLSRRRHVHALRPRLERACGAADGRGAGRAGVPQSDNGAEIWLLVLRWPVLGGAAIAVALILYRWGPRRRPPPWRWLWPGAVAAPLLWLIASSALTFALREFPAFGAAYGSLASVVALLLWLYVTALVFLLGGALNAELEFFALGKPAQPVVAGETIEPPIAADGGQKQVAGR